MLLRQLEYVVALARERHVARAAASCHVSQPSLSAGIRRLEEELGVDVVDRGSRVVRFTPEGERVVERARRILAERDGLASDVEALQAGPPVTVRIGVVPTAVPVVPVLTGAMCAAHPGARVVVETACGQDLRRRITDGELDAAVGYLPDPVPPDLQVVPVYRERYLLLTPTEGPFSDLGEIGWARVASVPLCLPRPGTVFRQLLDERFERVGVRPQAAVEADDVSVLCAYVATGRRSAVIAHPWQSHGGLAPATRTLPITGGNQGPEIGLLLPDREPDAPLRALIVAAEQARRPLGPQQQQQQQQHREFAGR